MKLSSLFLLLICIIFSFGACSSIPTNKTKLPKEAAVLIANDSLEYEIIIIDIGFTAYLTSTAKPEGFYTQEYMENRNSIWVASWNSRAQSPSKYNTRIYENIIDYQSQEDYGYEVNYKLFNYFLFAQRKYKINLGGGFRSGRIN